MKTTTFHKNILVLTPVYPANDVHKSTTPVVHYFTREWVKMGYKVLVVHYPVNFPRIIYSIIKPFKERISSVVGSEIRTWAVHETEYELEGVTVKRFPLIKIKPHGRYSKKQIKKATVKTISYCEAKAFKPDVIISHWVNPSLEIMHHLKAYFQVPTCYVAHDEGRDLMTIMKKEATEYIKETDIIGYRSGHIKSVFEEGFNCKDKTSFLCSSGIPESYLLSSERDIKEVKSFVFVGTLIQRKYPAEIVPAVYDVFGEEDFSVTYVGDGKETERVGKIAKELGIEEKVHLLGRIPRNEVVRQLDKNDVFVMISRGETFGLVYLEAMARGCITIAARKEGFDGIIKDGENGFLCEAGNEKELAAIIRRLKGMTVKELSTISHRAQHTAFELTDIKAAKYYIEQVMTIVNTNNAEA